MNRLVNSFLQYFLQGLVFLVPIALTVYIFLAVFRIVDGWLGIPIPGIGALLVVVLTAGFGFLASNFLTRRFLVLFENLLDRLPFAKLLHTSVKDLMNAFVGEKKRFTHPVAVELVPGSGIRALGFVTQESLAHLQLTDDVAVYLPQAYNFAGQLLVVPRRQLMVLSVDSSHLMAFVVSGGITGK